MPDDFLHCTKLYMVLLAWLDLSTACMLGGKTVLWHCRKSGKPTIVLEALADHNLWFWHHSFGYPGSLNNINIWNRSCLLKAFLYGSFANNVDFKFRIGNVRVFHCLWVLVDGIYPKLSRFVKTIQELVGSKASRYARWQESAQKDVEQAFGVMQRKFQVLVQKIEHWYVGDIANIFNCCICLHNMMVANRMAMGDKESEEFYAERQRQQFKRARAARESLC